MTEDLKKALQEVTDQQLTGIVLDLRNNPGGLLQEAVGVSSQFLKDGTVLQERDAEGKVKSIDVEPGGLATDMPLVVLINGGTASASEIVSGALQDAGRATVIGETTFGTGTVLQQYKLSDGSALLLAFEEWLTPKGRVIWHQGIEPDVKVTLPLNVYLVTPNSERSMSADEVKSSEDAQLLRAIEQLTQHTPANKSRKETGGHTAAVQAPDLRFLLCGSRRRLCRLRARRRSNLPHLKSLCPQHLLGSVRRADNAGWRRCGQTGRSGLWRE